MKFFVIFCGIVHFVSASPTLGGLLGGSSTSGAADSSASSSGLSGGSSLAGGSNGGGFPGGKIIGDVLGAKIALLTFLKNSVSPKEDQTLDFASFENDGSIGESNSGAGLSQTGSQMFSGNSGFSQLSGGGSDSLSGSVQTQSFGSGSSGQGYNYPPPSSGQGFSGELSSGGYAYQRPAQTSNALSSSGYSSSSSQQVNPGISEYSSGSATVENNGFSSSGSSSNGFSTSGDTNDADFDSFDTQPSTSSSGGLGSLVQIPLKLISTKVGIIQSLFGGANRQESRRFYL